MHVSLPAALKEWVVEQIERGGYGTASEYIRQLLREEQKRQARRAVEAKLEEAAASGDPVPVTVETGEESARRVDERLRTQRKKPARHARRR